MKTISAILASLLILGALAQSQVSVEFTSAQSQFSDQSDASWQNGNPQGSVINVDDSTQYQSMAGFGAALADSSADLIYNLDGSDYWNVINSLFSPSSGIGMNYIRLPISACDFSLSDYTYDNLPDGQTDPGLQSFSISHDEQYIIPVIQSILQVNPNVKIMATPWSPPAWMKNIDTLVGQTNDGESNLLQNFYDTYANFLVKTIQAYQNEGITIDTMTVQNEPLNGAWGYPAMVMDQYMQSDFINNHLANAFLQNNIQTKIFVYDHNWDREDYPAYVYQNLNSQAQQIVAGAAFHCYAGDVSAQTTFHNSFPNSHLYFTECTAQDDNNFAGDFVWDMQNILIGAVNNWAEASMKWVIALDQNNGPQNGGCTNCRGLLRIHTDTNQIDYNEDYYAIGVFSKHVPQGATRINVSSNDGNFIATGFTNPDNSRTVIVLNQDGSDHDFSLSWNGNYIQSTLPGQTVGVYTWST